jgi:predicted GTPase
VHVVVVDALRAGDVDTHHPGEAVARMADVIVVNKVGAAPRDAVEQAIEAARRMAPDALLLRADSPVHLEHPERVRGKRVLVVDDGPTLTHGGMAYGAGYVAAVEAGAAEIVDPRDSATPAIAAVFARYPHLGRVLPAMGYDEAQREALRETIDRSDAECVVVGTPTDLARSIGIGKPSVRARYAHADLDDPGLAGVVDRFAERVERRGGTADRRSSR